MTDSLSTLDHAMTDSLSTLDHAMTDSLSTLDHAMTDSITPPPELVQQWNMEGRHQDYCTLTESIAARAAQWGADQELEACCEWLHWQNLATHAELIPSLRTARRPKPQSLKAQALMAINAIDAGTDKLGDSDIIRRALEQLDD